MYFYDTTGNDVTLTLAGLLQTLPAGVSDDTQAFGSTAIHWVYPLQGVATKLVGVP